MVLYRSDLNSLLHSLGEEKLSVILHLTGSSPGLYILGSNIDSASFCHLESCLVAMTDEVENIIFVNCCKYCWSKTVPEIFFYFNVGRVQFSPYLLHYFAIGGYILSACCICLRGRIYTFHRRNEPETPASYILDCILNYESCYFCNSYYFWRHVMKLLSSHA